LTASLPIADNDQITEIRRNTMLDTKISDFTLPATGGQDFNLATQAGKVVVIYFYPKDSTPGCTTEAQQFRDLYPEFVAVDAVILGISRDSLKSHESFKAKQSLPFELGADTDEAVCTLFSVMKNKNMYGKQVRGVERSTFVIDRNGVLRREWRGVKVPGHAEEVLAFVKAL
jgi:peroxiredoxin Q/BCP